jgi:aminoglycoside phosphotransferase (APT) family kinase protein
MAARSHADWDLVSLAGPQADLAWWILMDPPESRQLEGIGTYEELVGLWEEVMGVRASDLRWYLVFGAYRLAAIFARLFAMMVAQGHMSEEARRAQLASGNPVQWMSGLLDLTPPRGVVPRVPDLQLERG